MAHPRMYDDADPLLGRVRACCAALPQALDLDAPDLDWAEVAELIDTAYRMVASARMLRALDAGR